MRLDSARTPAFVPVTVLAQAPQPTKVPEGCIEIVLPVGAVVTKRNSLLNLRRRCPIYGPPCRDLPNVHRH